MIRNWYWRSISKILIHRVQSQAEPPHFSSVSGGEEVRGGGCPRLEYSGMPCGGCPLCAVRIEVQGNIEVLTKLYTIVPTSTYRMRRTKIQDCRHWLQCGGAIKCEIRITNDSLKREWEPMRRLSITRCPGGSATVSTAAALRHTTLSGATYRWGCIVVHESQVIVGRLADTNFRHHSVGGARLRWCYVDSWYVRYVQHD